MKSNKRITKENVIENIAETIAVLPDKEIDIRELLPVDKRVCGRFPSVVANRLSVEFFPDGTRLKYVWRTESGRVSWFCNNLTRKELDHLLEGIRTEPEK